MERKTDRRVRKTRAQLKSGLLNLLKKKSIQDITVQELVDEVDINRSTFYLHYTDIYDMLRKIEDEFFESCMDVLKEYELPRDQVTSLQEFTEDYGVLTALYHVVSDNSDLCLILIGPNGDLQFVNKVIATINDQMEQRTRRVIQVKNQQSDYIYDYCMYGCIGLIRRWLEQGTPEPPEKMAQLTAQLLAADLSYLQS